jgi:hypothetical protein
MNYKTNGCSARGDMNYKIKGSSDRGDMNSIINDIRTVEISTAE